MRQSVCVLLVILALFFNQVQANGLVCPALVGESLAFLKLNKDVYKWTLQKFDLPPEVVDAKLEVKKCTDQISFINRSLIEKGLKEVIFKCLVNGS